MTELDFDQELKSATGEAIFDVTYEDVLDDKGQFTVTKEGGKLMKKIVTPATLKGALIWALRQPGEKTESGQQKFDRENLVHKIVTKAELKSSDFTALRAQIGKHSNSDVVFAVWSILP